MESQRLILFFIFSFSLFMLVDAWQRDQNPAQQKPAVSDAPAEKKDASVPPIPSSEKLVPPAPPPTGTQAPAPSMPEGATVQVETDVYRAEISLVGGDLRRLEFTQHRGVEDRKANFVLFQQRPEHVYVAQSGLLGPGPADAQDDLRGRRSRNTRWNRARSVLEVRLQAPVANGVKVTKIYRFNRGTYVIDVAFEIANEGSHGAQALRLLPVSA